jgi:hypothetical protein
LNSLFPDGGIHKDDVNPMKTMMVDDGWVLRREYTLTNPLFSLNYELFDVPVQKPLVEIASYGIVDESLLPFRLVPRLVSKDGVVVPSSL